MLLISCAVVGSALWALPGFTSNGTMSVVNGTCCFLCALRRWPEIGQVVHLNGRAKGCFLMNRILLGIPSKLGRGKSRIFFEEQVKIRLLGKAYTVTNFL